MVSTVDLISHQAGHVGRPAAFPGLVGASSAAFLAASASIATTRFTAATGVSDGDREGGRATTGSVDNDEEEKEDKGGGEGGHLSSHSAASHLDPREGRVVMDGEEDRTLEIAAAAADGGIDDHGNDAGESDPELIALWNGGGGSVVKGSWASQGNLKDDNDDLLAFCKVWRAGWRFSFVIYICILGIIYVCMFTCCVIPYYCVLISGHI